MNQQQPKQSFPTWKQALLILCSGIVLGLSSCAAFIATMFQNRSILPWIFEAGFLIGGATAGLGFILVLIRAIRGRGGPRQ